jgi:hypothetical protein
MQRSKPWITEEEEYLRDDLERRADEWEELQKIRMIPTTSKQYKRFNSKKRVRNRQISKDRELPF